MTHDVIGVKPWIEEQRRGVDCTVCSEFVSSNARCHYLWATFYFVLLLGVRVFLRVGVPCLASLLVGGEGVCPWGVWFAGPACAVREGCFVSLGIFGVFLGIGFCLSARTASRRLRPNGPRHDRLILKGSPRNFNSSEEGTRLCFAFY